ncbi:MAG: AAA family ATPase [Bacteroidetes bacterium]|nr:AAA family ATPase [Bacteroidota bacterium]
MTQFNPFIFLKRFVVFTLAGKIAYDETFHKGINIIRGKNSSGKSTITNFIFYALGGDFSNWTTEATKCQTVYAEVDINGAILTIKRDIIESSRQPMSIFWGNYDEAKKSASEGWNTFPYQQTDNKLSFTNVLFKALEYPEVKSDDDSSNITMHQILRLLYIDQDSPTQSLYRFERFDLPLTRQAISEVLLGTYDDLLYSKRLQLKQLKKEHDDKKREYDNIRKLFQTSGNEISIEKLNKDIEDYWEDLNKIEKQIIEARELDIIKRSKRTPLLVEKLQKDIHPLKESIRNIDNQIENYRLEILDSEHFISSLERRVKELDNSIITRESLGELPLTHCPQCLNELPQDTLEGHCFLCKQPIEEEEGVTHAKRMKQELELQIKESNQFLKVKKTKLSEFYTKIEIKIQQARTLQKEIDIAVKESKSTRDEKIDELIEKKGFIKSAIEGLIEQIKTAETLDQLKKDIIKLTDAITKLSLDIYEKGRLQYQKSNLAVDKIQAYAVNLLKKDLDRQNEFKNAKVVKVDFTNNTFSLDEKFNFSASSNTYLKNAVRFGIFFASLELGFFRFPRFVLCDNMEDKGMEQVRTQNLQKQLVDISNSLEVEHQLIFSTSMIDTSLNNTSMCVGEEYDENNKSLKHVD